VRSFTPLNWCPLPALPGDIMLASQGSLNALLLGRGRLYRDRLVVQPTKTACRGCCPTDYRGSLRLRVDKTCTVPERPLPKTPCSTACQRSRSAQNNKRGFRSFGKSISTLEGPVVLAPFTGPLLQEVSVRLSCTTMQAPTAVQGSTVTVANPTTTAATASAPAAGASSLITGHAT